MSTKTTEIRPGGRSTSARRHPLLSTFWCKIVMAVTGLIFSAFVLVHMFGNLKVYQGAEHFNAYAAWLRAAFEPVLPHEGLLWVLRLVLLASLTGHVVCAAILWRRARLARGPFRRRHLPLRSFTARTMPVTGLVLLFFVVFHVLDLTTGTSPAASDSFAAATTDSSHAYENLIASFQRPEVGVFYALAMIVLALHVAHGIWTAAHDLGATGRRLRATLVAASGVIALVILIGNISIPILVLLGVLQ
ncbi:succinate dehydrogenase [Cryobacterium melibiosiphilum]|uniref:Succinate dehydrogenase n=1 Tax=Cryobacterium melibiosiphilum TaxID=995039 RepID=A0A3A5MF66_9MICO|nr:succinate dehydrogenase cytochrome b subunit [Cryobacterium melibiosiphilum]RJT85733.1 succinate dehydrogenase [Cryobacterium melibiosiphilum]